MEDKLPYLGRPDREPSLIIDRHTDIHTRIDTHTDTRTGTVTHIDRETNKATNRPTEGHTYRHIGKQNEILSHEQTDIIHICYNHTLHTHATITRTQRNSQTNTHRDIQEGKRILQVELSCYLTHPI